MGDAKRRRANDPSFGRSYPRGRISGDDKGQTVAGIAVDPETNTLIIRYSKPMEWVGYDPDSAMQFLMLLAKSVARLTGTPISVAMGDADDLLQNSPNQLTNVEMHENLDRLVAAYITDKHIRPSEVSVIQLLQWSHDRTKFPATENEDG